MRSHGSGATELLERGELGDECGGKKVAAGGHDLAELDEGDAGVLERLDQRPPDLGSVAATRVRAEDAAQTVAQDHRPDLQVPARPPAASDGVPEPGDRVTHAPGRDEHLGDQEHGDADEERPHQCDEQDRGHDRQVDRAVAGDGVLEPSTRRDAVEGRGEQHVVRDPDGEPAHPADRNTEQAPRHEGDEERDDDGGHRRREPEPEAHLALRRAGRGSRRWRSVPTA